MEADEQRHAQNRLESDYLAGKISADEYTRLRRALHEEASPTDGAQPAPAIASWGSRAAALLVDVVVLVLLIVVTGIVLVTADAFGDVAAGLYTLQLFLLPGLYNWLMTGAWGQTLGKMAVGIKVVQSADYARVGYLRALGRVASIWVLGFFFFPLLLAYLWPLWDDRNQTLYDKMSGTVVVRA